MPQLFPFRALRPSPELVQVVSSRSFDSNSNDLAWNLMSANEYSYLHVVKPHLHFPEKERIPEKHYPFARMRLLDMMKTGVLNRETNNTLYLYAQHNLLLNYTVWGLIGLAAVEDYLQNRIMRHEKTLSSKEDLLVAHMEYTKAVGEPVLLTFSGGQWFDDLLENIAVRQPFFDFSTDDGLQHRLWRIDDSETLQNIRSMFTADSGNFYIADGHHRCAGAARYYELAKSRGEINTGQEPAAHFMACLVPANQIRLFEFNRLVENLNGMTDAEFLRKLADVFKIEIIGQARLHVRKKRFRYGMYLGGLWYGLDLIKPIEGKVPEILDVNILETQILRPLLGIENAKTDKRLAFLEGTKGIDRLQELVDNGQYRVAFSLFPCSVQDVMDISHLGLTMPPKSTWFEPKLRTGMLIHPLD